MDEEETYAALILAVAGVNRMNWSSRISEYLETDVSLYAVGQGALGVECRKDDMAICNLLAPFSHPDTLLRCIAERAFLRTLEGGCSAPVAVDSRIQYSVLYLTGGVWSLDGSQNVTQSLEVELIDLSSTNDTTSYAAIVASHVNSSHLSLAEWYLSYY